MSSKNDDSVISASNTSKNKNDLNTTSTDSIRKIVLSDHAEKTFNTTLCAMKCLGLLFIFVVTLFTLAPFVVMFFLTIKEHVLNALSSYWHIYMITLFSITTLFGLLSLVHRSAASNFTKHIADMPKKRFQTYND